MSHTWRKAGLWAPGITQSFSWCMGKWFCFQILREEQHKKMYAQGICPGSLVWQWLLGIESSLHHLGFSWMVVINWALAGLLCSWDVNKYGVWFVLYILLKSRVVHFVCFSFWSHYGCSMPSCSCNRMRSDTGCFILLQTSCSGACHFDCWHSNYQHLPLFQLPAFLWVLLHMDVSIHASFRPVLMFLLQIFTLLFVAHWCSFCFLSQNFLFFWKQANYSLKVLRRNVCLIAEDLLGC